MPAGQVNQASQLVEREHQVRLDLVSRNKKHHSPMACEVRWRSESNMGKNWRENNARISEKLLVKQC
jgi:hypothetical protein